MTIVAREPRWHEKTEALWNPSVDILETENGFTLQLDLPGLQRDNIKLHVKESVLTVQGDRATQERRDDKYFFCERPSGAFERSFRLPDHVDTGNITAEYENGVLTLTMPQRAESLPRTIEIK
jgi:HSP20 family protein